MKKDAFKKLEDMKKKELTKSQMEQVFKEARKEKALENSNSK